MRQNYLSYFVVAIVLFILVSWVFYFQLTFKKVLRNLEEASRLEQLSYEKFVEKLAEAKLRR